MFDTFEAVEQKVDLEYQAHVKKLCEDAGSCGDCFACLGEYPEQCKGPEYDWGNEDET